MQYPKPTVIEATSAHTATVIMMHGLGDTAAGWAPVGQQLRAGLPHVKFVFPTAPTVRPLARDRVTQGDRPPE
jgi:predicted esterase